MEIEVLLLVIILILMSVIVVMMCLKDRTDRKYDRIKFSETVLFEKLCSRKLWVAFISFFTTMSVTFGIDEVTTEQIIGTCAAVSTLLAYIGAEGYADGNSPTNKIDEIVVERQEENNE